MKYLPSGGAVTNISLATSERWTDKQGQKQETTEWHRIVFFGKLAETVNQYTAKGKQLYVEGRIKTESWEKDGVKKYATKIYGDKIVFIGAAQEGGQSQGQSRPQSNSNDAYDTNMDASFSADDIPF